jgi:hypothetical protein
MSTFHPALSADWWRQNSAAAAARPLDADLLSSRPAAARSGRHARSRVAAWTRADLAARWGRPYCPRPTPVSRLLASLLADVGLMSALQVCVPVRVPRDAMN